MNNITKTIILSAIATTAITALPTTAQAQQYPGHGYQPQQYPGQVPQGYPTQGFQNPGFNPYGANNQMQQFIQQDWQRQQQQLIDMMQGTSDMQTQFYNQYMQDLQHDAYQVSPW